jgi:hypothetical protein
MGRVVDARLTLRIPRGSQQDLREEARERLARVESVDRVDAFDVTDVRPGLNDLRVRARVSVVCTRGSEARLDDRLTDGVGVERVELVGGERER